MFFGVVCYCAVVRYHNHIVVGGSYVVGDGVVDILACVVGGIGVVVVCSVLFAAMSSSRIENVTLCVSV